MSPVWLATSSELYVDRAIHALQKDMLMEAALLAKIVSFEL